MINPMFFSRYLMNASFDEEKIKNLHSYLLPNFPDAELEWKYKINTVSNPADADIAMTWINGEKFLTISRKEEKASFKFSIVDGDEEEALDAIRKSGLGYMPPELTNSIALAVVYALLLTLLCFMYEPEIVTILLVFIGILILGTALYFTSLKMK